MRTTDTPEQLSEQVPEQFAVQLQAKFFRGFSDPSRLSILLVLRQRPCSVSEIVRTTGLSQSNVSNHLSCLRDCGLVIAQPEGRYMFYQLSSPRVLELLRLAEEILLHVAKGVEECVNYEAQDTGASMHWQPQARAHV
ncbi:MAG: metalloregulator ArsR/SmtB family transcription factor [Litorilinea sp.]